MSCWKRMFRGSVREARELMSARRSVYSWEVAIEVFVDDFGDGSILDLEDSF